MPSSSFAIKLPGRERRVATNYRRGEMREEADDEKAEQRVKEQ
jgi:hypothetical protein